MPRIKVKNTKKRGADAPKVADNGINDGENLAIIDSNDMPAEPRKFGVEAKAEYIINNGLSDKSYKTLRGKSNAELDAIIEAGGEPEKPTASPDSVKVVINAYLDICDTIKKARCDEGISDNLRNLALKSAPHLAARAESKTIGYMIIGAGLLALVVVAVDAVIGLNNIKKIFVRDKNKESQKATPQSGGDILAQWKKDKEQVA